MALAEYECTTVRRVAGCKGHSVVSADRLGQAEILESSSLRAGVSSIEHGSVLSDESIELMKGHGTYLAPYLYINSLPLPPETPAATMAKSDYLKPLVVQSLKKAYKAGVNMALGTDACIFPHGQNGREFA